MTIGLSSALRVARITLLLDAIDAGASGGTISFYTGARPATGAAITTQTLICQCDLDQPCGEVVGASIQFGTITAGAVLSDAAPIAWARVRDGDGVFVMDMSVGLSDADIVVNTLTPGLGSEFSPTGAQSISEGGA